MTAHVLIDALEAAPAWSQLSMSEQIALRAIVRRAAAMAANGATPEDWQQLAGYAEWAHKPGAPAPMPTLATATVAGQWIDWLGGNRPVTADTRVEAELRGGASFTGRAGGIFWCRDGQPGEILRYRVVD